MKKKSKRFKKWERKLNFTDTVQNTGCSERNINLREVIRYS